MIEANPYETPAAVEADVALSELRRPAFGTILVALWSLEAGVKTAFIGYALARGFSPFALAQFADDYRMWNRIAFFLVSSFLIVETIGPWIGIYYLTGRRARTIPFEQAILRTLALACGIAIIAAILLMVYFELLT